jgi:hypothetical protein
VVLLSDYSNIFLFHEQIHVDITLYGYYFMPELFPDISYFGCSPNVIPELGSEVRMLNLKERHGKG